MTFYKILEVDGSARMGTGKWFLPTRGRPGKWMPKIEGTLIPCQRGYHLCRPEGLIDWLGPAIYEAEYRGETIGKDPGVIVVREARLLYKISTWNDRTARLFACDCATRVLKIFEKAYPQDTRPRKAIAVAQRFANGLATEVERDVAGAAAWDAARAAAWDAARAAAGAAASDAAGAAEKKWQTQRLLEYLSGKRK